MSEKIICTISELDNFVKNNVSKERYNHSIGVVNTMKKLFQIYGTDSSVARCGAFDVCSWCGLTHDIAREYSDSKILDFCKKEKIELESEYINHPVLAHGIVSSIISSKLCAINIPKTWKNAVIFHTTGDASLDRVGMALFVADFIEPGRKFLTEEDRRKYLKNENLERLCYNVLVDLMNYWKGKAGINPSLHSEGFLAALEEKAY